MILFFLLLIADSDYLIPRFHVSKIAALMCVITLLMLLYVRI